MKTLAVTSGKGGVGKTNLSANLAIQLAQRGERTVVFDADIGLANLDVVLGVKSIFTLQSVLTGERRLSQVVAVGPGGIRFVAGGSGIETLVNLTGPRADNFLSQLGELEESTDVLIFDTGAGIDGNVMTFLEAADEVLLVITPDPASITDGYATAKALLMRKPEATVRVILNMVDSEAQARAVFAKVYSIAQQFLGKRLEFGGFVRQDLRALHFIRQRTPFILGDPNTPASRDVANIAAALRGEKVVQTQSLADRLRGLFSGGQKAA